MIRGASLATGVVCSRLDGGVLAGSGRTEFGFFGVNVEKGDRIHG
jgi:hypothetical protein|tara:strand:+ start:2824 stop:2958 length:135 start_codon:yes stop_codon:yes gene_type:complete